MRNSPYQRYTPEGVQAREQQTKLVISERIFQRVLALDIKNDTLKAIQSDIRKHQGD